MCTLGHTFSSRSQLSPGSFGVDAFQELLPCTCSSGSDTAELGTASFLTCRAPYHMLPAPRKGDPSNTTHVLPTWISTGFFLGLYP